jgi:hypothetical protein
MFAKEEKKRLQPYRVSAGGDQTFGQKGCVGGGCRRGDTAPFVRQCPPTCSQCPFTRVVVHRCSPLSSVIRWLRCQKGCQPGVFLLPFQARCQRLEVDLIRGDNRPGIFEPASNTRSAALFARKGVEKGTSTVTTMTSTTANMNLNWTHTVGRSKI